MQIKQEITSIVVVFADTSDICIIRNPITLNANARFKTVNKATMVRTYKCNQIHSERIVKKLPKARNVVARVPGVPGISPSLKNAIKCGSNETVTKVVSRNV